MSFQPKTERAAKTKATEAIKSLAKSSKGHIKQEDNVTFLVIRKEEIHEESDDEDDPEILEREQFASECRRN